MGDRNNLIKFGPEWMRNVPSVNNQNANPASSTSTANPSGGSVTVSSSMAQQPSNNTATRTSSTKVFLAKQRYGREEMLVLYDGSVRAPQELRVNDVLYQARGKRPFALQNSFEDELRGSTRNAPITGGIPGERYVTGRGRGLHTRLHVPFVRPTPRGRGRLALWNSRPTFSGTNEDEPGPSLRSWSNANGSPHHPSGTDQAEWSNKFRNKRNNTSNNWRQPQTREEGDEWRSTETGRTGQYQDNKWGTDWGDRTTADKHAWSSQRHTWATGETQQSDDTLPEWATENAEACGGTFDSSGAFHGYTNNDSNVPKSTNAPYPLTRSHTQGSFVRPKPGEGSQEWWASEKAKKLSPKRFDAGDFRSKMASARGPTDTGLDAVPTTTATPATILVDEIPERDKPAEDAATALEQSDNSSGESQDVYKYDESNMFDSMMQSEMNIEEANDVRGNFQSVMITPNNSLRQKHQFHLAPSAQDSQNMRNFNTKVHSFRKASAGSHSSSEQDIPNIEDSLIDDIMDLSLENSMPSGKRQSQINTTKVSTSFSTTAAQAAIMQAKMQSGNRPGSSLLSRMQTGNQTGLQSGSKSNMPSGSKSIMHSTLQPKTALHSGSQPGQSTIQPGLQSGLQPGQPVIHSNRRSVLQSGLQAGLQSGQSIQSNLQSALQSGLVGPSGIQPGTQSALHSTLPPGQSVMQPGLQSSVQSQLMMPSPLQSMHTGLMQPIGISNSALNASLGLPIRSRKHTIVPPLPDMQTMPPNPAVSNTNLNSGIQNGSGPSVLQSGGIGLPSFQSGGNLPGRNNNIGNSSMYLTQNSGNAGLPHPNNVPMPNQGGQANVYPMHGLQEANSTTGFDTSMLNMMMQQPPPVTPDTPLSEQWYYKDPMDKIQGPFTSKEMYCWYRAGFFSTSLMVRRACDPVMRTLGSYGPIVPFAQVDIIAAFPTTGFEAGPSRPQNPALNSQSNISIEQSLWGQPSQSPNLAWMQDLDESRCRDLSRYFWRQAPATITYQSVLPDEMPKEMKSEDEILAQLRASQRLPSPSNLSFMGDQSALSTSKKIVDDFAEVNLTPKVIELTKLILNDSLDDAELTENDSKPEKNNVAAQLQSEAETKNNTQQILTDSKTQVQTKPVVEAKQTKQKPEKSDNEKSTKNKENNNTKNKSKKSKEEKKDDIPELKTKEDEIIKIEKRSAEPSPSKSKKDEKANKKELEKEKKEWIKEGFTIVKGPEKNTNRENKKKVEEARAAEESERKRKEEEKLAAEEKKQKQTDTSKKQQEQQQQLKQAWESVLKKAPWSAVANQAMQATNKDGLTLAEIQRLEREKKLEQIKEQQQMMQIIAQQQAAAFAREQEMQAGLGWAKKRRSTSSPVGQSLAEIQAETRKQAVTASQPIAEIQVTSAPPVNHVPWGNAQNGGFWDTPSNQTQKQAQKPAEPSSKPVNQKVVDQNKVKKKPAVTVPVKKETSPAVEFEAWCTHVLASYSSKIDVPTFVGFLKDIESPYEVKDYVKCYLGDSKDSGDFARQFLEKRSKLLRVGMVTPSDDLCKPALAVNPRTVSGSDYQEGKTKKAKKNKMVKVDTRILGFSVTASEDRINVGDIDTV